jgi:hypothetical protein
MAAIGADQYGDKLKTFKWDWRDKRIMDWINNFVNISRRNVYANVDRLKVKNTGALKRSLAWKTFAVSGGDGQVFSARYLYYEKYVELALGKGDPYNGPVPEIPGAQWQPIPVPTRRRKGRPFVVTEMRRQAAKFESMARGEFSFVGTVFLVYAMGRNKAASAAINRALFWSQRLERTTR